MTFLEKYELLKKSIPMPAVDIGPFTQNSEMVDMTFRAKNCYFCFWCYRVEDVMYSTTTVLSKHLVDCDWCMDSELLYESTNCTGCYGSTYLEESNKCRDCHFSTLLASCSDCFGCVGLTHKQYCIFNKQYTKEEYFNQVAELKKLPPEAILQKMRELQKTIPQPASKQFTTQNCPYGDHITNSKNSFWCFNVDGLEDCGYNFLTVINTKNCWDTFYFGERSELCYEMIDAGRCYNCAFVKTTGDSSNCFYSMYLQSCKDCFGCVGLSNKQHCVLNNQLTKEEYEKAVIEIKRELGWKV